MTASLHQLAFELPHRPALGLEDFLVSNSNSEAVALVDRWPDWPTGAALICGGAGSGKSHLANVWRRRSGAHVVAAARLVSDDVPTLTQAGAIVVEDVTDIADQPALFHLLNLVREQRLAMLLTANRAPGELQLSLPDLTSRLKALPVAAIAPPDDALLRAVLVKLFADRQLAVEPHIIDYVLARMERSMAAARSVVADVDRRTLEMKRPVSRPVIAEVLEQLEMRGNS